MKDHGPYRRLLVIIILALGLSACGGSGLDTVGTGGATSATDVPSFEANTELSFTLTIAIDSADDDLDFAIDLENPYTMPLKIEGDGTVNVRAQDIERMVYRVCALNSQTPDCDTHTELITGDFDIVIDSCGRFVGDENCGGDDDTIYSGLFSADGSLSIDDLSIRMRIFLVTDEQDGTTADDTDEGLAAMNRLIIDLTTSKASAGSLSAEGSEWDGQKIVLVSAGTISSTVETLGGSDFATLLTGTFSPDPFTLLD